MSDSDQPARGKRRAVILSKEVITNNRLEFADEVLTPNFHWSQFDLTDPEGAREWVRVFRTAFPDMNDRVQEQIIGGDAVVTRMRYTGTQDGLFRGLPPSGEHADFTATGIDRFEGDYIAERSAHFGIADLMRQLGHTILHVPKVDRP